MSKASDMYWTGYNAGRASMGEEVKESVRELYYELIATHHGKFADKLAEAIERIEP